MDGLGYAVHPGQEDIVLKDKNQEIRVSDIHAWLATWCKTAAPLAYIIVACFQQYPPADALQQNTIKSNVILLNLKRDASFRNGWFLESIGVQERERSFPSYSSTYQRDLEAELYINVAFKTAAGDAQLSGCIYAQQGAKNTISEMKKHYDNVRHIHLTQQEAMELLEIQKEPGVVRFGRIVILQTESGEVIHLPASRLH